VASTAVCLWLLQRITTRTARQCRLGAGNKFDYNSYYLGIGSTGNLTDRLQYTLEAVYEAGTPVEQSV